MLADHAALSSRGVAAGPEGGGHRRFPSFGNQSQPLRTDPKTAWAQMSDTIAFPSVYPLKSVARFQPVCNLTVT